MGFFLKENESCGHEDSHFVGPQGPNEDIGMCAHGYPIGVLRPYGESFGWHADDCSLSMYHRGFCVGGGKGHVMPEGWKLRG